VITLTADAGTYPFKYFSYQLDNDNIPPKIYDGPITVTTNGYHHITFFAIDDHNYTDIKRIVNFTINRQLNATSSPLNITPTASSSTMTPNSPTPFSRSTPFPGTVAGLMALFAGYAAAVWRPRSL
jgi:hypothetical protein